MTRMRWNVTDTQTGETFRTSVIGASLIGCPMMTHGRSPFMAWGVTAINPDVTDLYVEFIRVDKYLATDKQWLPLESRQETIKVRFAEDYNLTLFFTRNGIILPTDFIEGKAKDLMPWISADAL